MNAPKTKGNVVLLYSGGLDTSAILHWLAMQGYNVTCFTANIGQQDLRNQEELTKKAYNCGASNVIIMDLQERFVLDHIFPCMRFHAVYGGGYHMCCSMARPLIAQGAIEAMQGIENPLYAHGATGKGNDQVRFELAALALQYGIRVLTLWRDYEFRKQFSSRDDMLNYAKKHGIPVTASKDAPYSNDGNMAGETFEAGVLEKLWIDLPKGMFKLTKDLLDAPNTPEEIEIFFENGIPILIDGQQMSPVEIIHHLNKVGGEHGVGRYGMVEDRRVGMKSRGEYEEPALHILWRAHHALEALVLDKESIRYKERVSPEFAQMVYDGDWFCAKMQTMQIIGLQHQQFVTGRIRLKLFKGTIAITGWESHFSLYDEEMASMDKDNPAVYDQADAGGHIRIAAVPLIAQVSRGRDLRHKE